jgi:Delta14-sterol reductase
MASSTAVEKKSELNPRTTSYEFCGPIGATLITVGVPLTTYLLYFGCSQRNGCPPSLTSIKNPEILDALQEPEFWKSLWDTEAALMYLGWYAFCIVAWFVLPGDWIDGTLMRNGEKMKYKINGTQFLHHLAFRAAGQFCCFQPSLRSS